MNDLITMVDIKALQASSAVASVQQVMGGFKTFQVLRAALGSGLFDWLAANGPAERTMISSAVRLRGAHLAGFLQALEDLGCVSRTDGKYALADTMAEALLRDSPWYQGEVLHALASQENSWSNFARFMSEERPVQPAALPASIEQNPFLDEAREFASWLGQREGGQAANDPVQRVLCFDGTGGLVSAMLCRLFPQWQVYSVLPATAVAGATRLLHDQELTERCHIEAGSPLEFSRVGRYDKAVLFHALYPVRKDVIRSLKGIADHLVPGGELYAAHWFCLEACETAPGGMQDLERAVLIDHHPMCHIETFGQRFTDAGLTYTGREDLAGAYGPLKLHYAVRGSATAVEE